MGGDTLSLRDRDAGWVPQADVVSGQPQLVRVFPGDGFPFEVLRPAPPPPRRIWLHAALFIATFLSTTFAGGVTFGRLPDGFVTDKIARVLLHPGFVLPGLEFSIPLMIILLAHEMGHYVACRRHRLDATLPFFLPLPVPLGIGTLGAFIRIRTAIANKRELFDVGAAGPIAGFLTAVPFLVAGVALSKPVPELPDTGYILFGDPLLFKAVSHLLHAEVAAGGDLLIHPTGFAAWVGLLVTALNLLPFGQLDGGHVTYAMFGALHRRAAWPLLLGLVALGFVWTGWWIWAVIALVMGVRHPRIADEPQPLDSRRMRLGWVCIVIFVLCFTPQPITIVS